MTWWQVQAKMASGGRFVFSVQAEDNMSALEQADRLIDGATVQIVKIPPPDMRLPAGQPGTAGTE